MEIRLLKKRQIRRAYRRYLQSDFPQNELRPLRNILSLRRRGIYGCFGLFEGKKLLAYGFLLRQGEARLLDYLGAVEKGKGFGSELLRQLPEGGKPLFAEVEDPALAESGEEKDQREKRVAFYRRAGFSDTGVSAETFGVVYRLLLRGETRPAADTEAQYLRFYREMMPAHICEKYVKIV